MNTPVALTIALGSNPVIPVALAILLLCVALFLSLLRSQNPHKAGPDAATLLIALIDAIPSAAYWKGADGRLMGVNRTFDNHFPLKESPTGSSPLAVRLSEAEAELIDADDLAALKEGTVRSGQAVQLMTADREPSLFTISRLVLPGPTGQPAGLLVLLSQLNPGDDTGGSLLSNEISWLFDLQGKRFIHVGPQFDHIWGRPRGPLLQGNERYADSLHPSDRTEDAPPTLPFGVAGEYRIVRPDGSIRTIRSASTPLMDDQGRELGMIAGVEEDVTEERRMADLLAKAGSPGLAATLGSAVAHEITQPLNAVSLRVSSLLFLLDKGEVPDAAMLKRYLTDIKNGSDRLARTVDHMRGLIRRDSVSQTAPVDINRCCEQGIDLLAAKAEAHSVALSFRPGQVPRVLADAKLLEQMVINLVSNSVHALADTDGYDKQIRVSTGSDGEKAWLAVDDNGPGIAESQREHIFEPFVSGESSQGTGLGLALTRHFARLWGGSARADHSHDLGGARIVIELPLLTDKRTG